VPDAGQSDERGQDPAGGSVDGDDELGVVAHANVIFMRPDVRPLARVAPSIGELTIAKGPQARMRLFARTNELRRLKTYYDGPIPILTLRTIIQLSYHNLRRRGCAFSILNAATRPSSCPCICGSFRRDVGASVLRATVTRQGQHRQMKDDGMNASC
jgi:hypothetical protein